MEPDENENDPSSTGLEAFQAELDRVGATERGRGVTAGKREVLSKTGFKTTDELIAFVESARSSGASASETEARATALAQENAQLRGEVGRLNIGQGLTNALLAAGVQGNRISAAAQLVSMRPEISNSPDGTPSSETIASSVDAFKHEYKEWFVVSHDGQGQQSASDGTPPGTPPGAPSWVVPPPSYVPVPTGTEGTPASNGAGSPPSNPAAIGDQWFDKLHGHEVQKRDQAEADMTRRAAEI